MTHCKLIVLLLICQGLWTIPSKAAEQQDLLNHTLEGLSPKGPVHLRSAFAGKLILAVNTASGCGYTPQFDGLETLYQKYKDSGLVVLGFPSNDFYQERKENADIVEFCKLRYGVTFPLFEKSSVKGPQANSFYQSLARATQGQYPEWNFFKYLIDPNEQVVEVFTSQEKPLGGRLEQQIRHLLETHPHQPAIPK